MDVGGPEPLVGYGGVVVGQRIEPDVGDEGGVEGEFDAPGEAGFRTRDAEIVHRLLEELENLVLPEARRNEVGVRLDMFDEPGLELRKLEVEILFGRLRNLAVDFRPRSVRIPILIGEELFLTSRVPVGLLPFVDQSLVEELL